MDVRKVIMPWYGALIAGLFLSFGLVIEMAAGHDSMKARALAAAERVEAARVPCRAGRVGLAADSSHIEVGLRCGQDTALATANPLTVAAVLARPDVPLRCDVRHNHTADCKLAAGPEASK